MTCPFSDTEADKSSSCFRHFLSPPLLYLNGLPENLVLGFQQSNFLLTGRGLDNGSRGRHGHLVTVPSGWPAD